MRPEEMQVDYVFCTHDHWDHANHETLEIIAKSSPKTRGGLKAQAGTQGGLIVPGAVLGSGGLPEALEHGKSRKPASLLRHESSRLCWVNSAPAMKH